MVGWLPKYYAECPRCGSIEIDVPWGLARARKRRILGLTLSGLWISLAGWVALGLALGSVWPWAAAGAAYLGLTILALAQTRRSLRQCACIRCSHRWSI